MAITAQLRSLARFEYGVLRSALGTVDRAVLTPLADRSPGFERVVTRAREAASELSERLAPAGRSPVERPEPAVRPEPRPEPKSESKPESKSEPKPGSKPTPEPRTTTEPDSGTVAAEAGSAVLDASEVKEVDGLAEDYLEADAVHVTGELAENEDLREVQARLRAKHTLQEQDEQHR